MMTEQLGFNILTAPLAAIDRRGLSQAWYSALHLARETAHGRAAHAVRDAVPAGRRAPAALPRAGSGGSPGAGAVAPRRTPPAARVEADERERRAQRSPLARKIERRFLDPVRRVQRASFTIDGGVRVHIALQTGPAGMRLVAVCPRSARERVRNALQEARYALAARGIALDPRISGEPA